MTQRFKPFFVHRQSDFVPFNAVERSKPRAFTAYIQPAENPREVKVQLAFCSSKDTFVKAVGRATALAHPEVIINARHLPKFLKDADEKMLYGGQNFDYILKYVV